MITTFQKSPILTTMTRVPFKDEEVERTMSSKSYSIYTTPGWSIDIRGISHEKEPAALRIASKAFGSEEWPEVEQRFRKLFTECKDTGVIVRVKPEWGFTEEQKKAVAYEIYEIHRTPGREVWDWKIAEEELQHGRYVALALYREREKFYEICCMATHPVLRLRELFAYPMKDAIETRWKEEYNAHHEDPSINIDPSGLFDPCIRSSNFMEEECRGK